MMYESMKMRIESVVEKGTIPDEYITNEQEHEAFSNWTPGFTRHQHPSIIQVLLESCKDKDISGNSMPNLIYVSREKSKTSQHHFKAGALNALIKNGRRGTGMVEVRDEKKIEASSIGHFVTFSSLYQLHKKTLDSYRVEMYSLSS
ncbi:hypothetical protein ACH5RR_006413 [Cinchona calisaya]|uniref:Uncharacterized protein n=1 Tax=Cinchona calisaya TaxID=153742 RepID=A0ABD3ANX8_9GENT